MLFFLCGTVLAAAVLAGGGTHSGFYGDVAVQLLAIPLFAAVIWPAFSKENPKRAKARLALGLAAAAAAPALLQVFPLPFDYWSGGTPFLPQDSGGALPEAIGPRPLSITPERSWAAVLSLIVPLAIFGAAIKLDLRQRMMLCLLLAGLGALSLALGFLQVAQGQASGLRFYAITNPTEAVGFFANRNHFAAHLNVTLVLAALWLVIAAEASLERGAFGSRSFLWFAAAAAFVVADVAGLAMARSRAGIFLAMAALAGIVLMALKQPRAAQAQAKRRSLSASRASFAAALVAVLFAAQFGLGSMLSRFEGDPFEDLRVTLNKTTLETIPKALPFGTGLGSFVPVYATVEKTDAVFAGYANRAHDDFAELLLETGLIGAGLLVAFLGWFSWRSYRAWRARPSDGHWVEPLLERAASLVIALLLLHSLVDYPLRTTALSAIFAFFCAILAAPAEPSDDWPLLERRQRQSGRRPAIPVEPGEKWDPETGWPESWRR